MALPGFIQPAGLPLDQWLTRLHSERSDLAREVRRAIHTNRSLGGHYKRIEQIDRAIAKAEKSAAPASQHMRPQG